MIKPYLFTILLFFSFSDILAQPVDDLFQQRNNLSKDYRSIARKYQPLALNNERFSSLRQSSPATLKLELPFENRQLKLDLKKVAITTDDFSVLEARADGSRHIVNYTGAVFYQGKIEGSSTSFATISIVNDQVSGIIADDKSNIILGAIEENGRATNEYTLYRESDLQIANPMNCFTSDIPVDGPANSNNNSSGRLDLIDKPVEIYFECDYKFYQDKGSNSINVINYVLSFFNNTSLLYNNEDVKIQVSQILVWTSQDPEVASGLNTSSAVLSSFASRMATTFYVGDYAHFLSTRSLGGGIAYLLSNPCGSSKANRTGVSAINNTYNNFPTYSWTVEVVTHELGHNLGSHHTHWCGWPGGAIDNCGPGGGYPNEGGSCAIGPTPTGGGTIMSYCHLVSTGINFNNGFGPLPGQAVRDVVSGSACFGNCRMTVDITKQDASCGQNNGSATATATNGTGNIIYLWSTGFIGNTLANVAPGTYHVSVGDSAGCQVMQVVTIGSGGTVLTFTLTPTGTAGFCAGGSVTLTATNNAAYTYVWRKDGNIIGGATLSNYVANASGTYSVTVSSGACSSTQSVVVSVVTAPFASVTPAGPTTFCDGSNVVLNGDAGSSYTYQWYNNAVLINGATNPTYSATASGNYTVKVSAGSSCEATSSAVAVTVNESPSANVTPATVTSFCDGGSVILNASAGTGYSYQWYRNGSLIAGAALSAYTATTAGTYTVTTTLGTCSRTSTGTNVTVWANPVVTVNPTTVTIEKYQTQVLTASGAVTYNWDLQPALINASTNTGTFKPLTTTNYTIQGTDANGCKGTANATIVVIGCGDVSNITATAYSPSRVIVRWINPAGSSTDTLQYRKVGSPSWTRVFVSGQEYEINGLTPGANYEYNVIALCSTTTVFLPSS
ncbi:MAG: M12 family metallo-peptidase, partial [Chitinophagales bacterium]